MRHAQKNLRNTAHSRFALQTTMSCIMLLLLGTMCAFSLAAQPSFEPQRPPLVNKPLATGQQPATPAPAQPSAEQAAPSHSMGLDWILFVIIALTLGTAARHWGTKLPVLRLFPYTVLLMLLGFAVGIVDRLHLFSGALSAFDSALGWAANIQPTLILFIFLPTLIFEASFAIDLHTFKKSVVNALILAVPGMILATVLTAASMMLMLDLPSWTLYLAMLFGAMVSATDPVAVVALLRELGASKKLSTLIDGESLLNDGVAIVIFTVFLEYVRMGASIDALNAAVLAQSFLKTVIGGTLIGIIIAATTIAWVRRVFNDALVEITVLVIAAYLTFYIAEHFLHVSGILGLMALGLIMSGVGRTSISPTVEHFLHNFWEMAAYLANTLIFIIVGVLIAERTVFSVQDVLNLFVLYGIINVVRALMIAMFYPLLKRFGYGITPKETVILWWGALRGALGLCLCLVVMQEAAIPKAIQQQMMFYMAGIVFLTLTVNATTIKWIITRLGLTVSSPARQAMLGNALQELAKQMNTTLLRYKYHDALSGVRWSAVREYLPSVPKRSELVVCDDEDLLAEIRLRLLETERALYQHAFHEGLLGADSLRELSADISLVMDNNGTTPLTERPYLATLWALPAYWKTLANVPFVRGFAHRRIARRRAFMYDTAKCFLEVQERLLVLVRQPELYDINQNDTFDDNERQMADTLSAEIHTLLVQAKTVLKRLRTEHPEVALAAETVDALRSTLNAELQAIDTLYHDGMLKLDDKLKLTERVEMQIKTLVNYSSVLPLPDTTELIREQPWMAQAQPEAVEAFLRRCGHQEFRAGETLLPQHSVPATAFIVVRGDVLCGASVQSLGAMVGMYEMLAQIRQPELVTAVTDVTVLSVTANALEQFFTQQPACREPLWRWASAATVQRLLVEHGHLQADDTTLDWLLTGTVSWLSPQESLQPNATTCIVLAGSVVESISGHHVSAPALLPGTMPLMAQSAAYLYVV